MIYNAWTECGDVIKDRKPRCEMHAGAMMDATENHPVFAETQWKEYGDRKCQLWLIKMQKMRKCPKSPKTGFPLQMRDFREKMAISGTEACGRYFSNLIAPIEYTCSRDHKYVYKTCFQIFIAKPVGDEDSEENRPIKCKNFDVWWRCSDITLHTQYTHQHHCIFPLFSRNARVHRGADIWSRHPDKAS